MDTKAKVEFLKKSMEKLMGTQLDYSRMSEMSERAQGQFERTTKAEFHKLTDLLCEVLLEQPKQNKIEK
jgi:hypothetical protein